MFCTNCGKEINDKAVICIGCGCEVKKSKVKEIKIKERKTEKIKTEERKIEESKTEERNYGKTMFCTNCGKEINDKTVICPSCGCEVQKSNEKENNSENFLTAPISGSDVLGFASGFASGIIKWIIIIILVAALIYCPFIVIAASIISVIVGIVTIKKGEVKSTGIIELAVGVAFLCLSIWFTVNIS